MSVPASRQEARIKESIRHIINQLQIITSAAEYDRPEVIRGSVDFIELLLAEIKRTV